MDATVTIGRPGQFRAFEEECKRALERAALRATDRAAKIATRDVREGMRGAGLGRLSNAIGSGSDHAKGRGVHRVSDGFSASGWVHVRGKSPRTLGAIEAYTQGASISPRNGKWLAIATAGIPQRVGRKRMTPELYRSSGLEQRIGPLKFVPGRQKNEALLIVDAPVSLGRFSGRGSTARRLPKRGAVRASRRVVNNLVAFILIRSTARTARTNPKAAIAAAARRLPELTAEELRKEI